MNTTESERISTARPGDRLVSSRLQHELRTPINHILGYGELLVEDAEDIGRLDRIDGLRAVIALGKEALAVLDGCRAGLLDIGSSGRLLRDPMERVILACEAMCEGFGEPDYCRDLERIKVAAARLIELSDRAMVDLEVSGN